MNFNDVMKIKCFMLLLCSISADAAPDISVLQCRAKCIDKVCTAQISFRNVVLGPIRQSLSGDFKGFFSNRNRTISERINCTISAKLAKVNILISLLEAKGILETRGNLF